MRIKRLTAQGIHGYLGVDVTFNERLTFLTGLNGSGKTSALRLLMALLTPNLEELGTIVFSRAELKVDEDGKAITVFSERSPDGVLLSISTQSEPLRISSAEIEILQDGRGREERRSPVFEKYFVNPVYESIRALSTPMFLGLDRKYASTWGPAEEPNEFRRKEYFYRRTLAEDRSLRDLGTTSLMDVNILVAMTLQEIRIEQERLDEQLREKFFITAFEYEKSPISVSVSEGSAEARSPLRMPSKTELEKYRKQLAIIEEVAEQGEKRIPIPAISALAAEFFEEMSRIVVALENQNKNRTAPLKGRRKVAKSSEIPEMASKEILEWIINKPQIDRISKHLSFLERYFDDRADLHKQINRFIDLINRFYEQTKKRIKIKSPDQLVISIEGDDNIRPITALSSGERQLLVMLAHLSLNRNLKGSGIFIVDEPELSLHIDWQEKFVEAVLDANPDVQLILATHSPAIILDRSESCISLS